MSSVAAVFSGEVDNAPLAGNISSSDDCTEINISYKLDGNLTREEAISKMDEAFYESLSKFDACQMSQSGAAGSASASSGGPGGAGGSDGSDGSDGSEGSGGVSSNSARSVASPDLSGTSTSITDDSSTTTTPKEGNIPTAVSAKGRERKIQRGVQTGSGKPPEDIPSADNDSVLEAQIRQAAMNETDPETKKKLWNEYRKYKGLSRPGD
jgi:hypothetical protein